MLPEADAPALDALAEEIEVRLSALRVEAAEFLEGLIVDGTHVQVPTESDPADCDERASLESAEDAIEVATSLGVDTGAAEERLASIRRMLSVRVVWDQAVCFCMLPLRVSFKALLQQVAARFQVKVPSTLQLWWTEAGELFRLDGDMAWEECLQRRGLAERPGRLELQVLNSSSAPRRCRRPRKMQKKTCETEMDVGQGGAAFLITGIQALQQAPGSQPEDQGQTRGVFRFGAQ
ncbi:Hypothetical protein SCF082_LOCUS31097 [Durusdinium trenchii]|uniref:Ubiquitin-like domain-containing protein n=1 Tax=Durusdinium trenchii TaxID=1381693 RepID=A0ABP0N7C8_9DINO